MTRRLSALAADALFVISLGAIALIGFHATFSGPDFLIAGAAGLVLGTGLAAIAYQLGQPGIVVAVFTVAAFFLLGGAAALHGLGGLSWLPVPDTLRTLLRGSVDGWKDLLTTLPPVDSGVLLVIPYLLGLVGGAAALTVATRTRSVIWPALVPIALMISVILLGSQRPGEVTANAGVFFAVLMAWVVLRTRRVQIRTAGATRTRQIAVAAALVIVATGLGTLIGPHLPGVSSDRYVLRSQIVPPFNIRQYPSPLASFRRYRPKFVGTDQVPSLAKQTLFHISGLPAGADFIRIATLDSYDGVVWAASNNTTAVNGVPEVNGVSDTFQRVGTTIGSGASGTPSGPITVKIDAAYVEAGTTTNVWLPTVGALTGIAFSNPPTEAMADQLRYNLATGTAILPGALRDGATYTINAVNAKPLMAEQSMAPATGPTVPCPLDGCASAATRLAGSGQTPMRQVFAVASALQGGTVTDGEPPNGFYTAGHSISRLNGFARYNDPKQQADGLVGDGEQYAAFMALMANQLHVPARVVFGAYVPSCDAGCDVHGSDIQAWVELELADGSWADLPQSAFLGRQITTPPLKTSETQPDTAQPVPAPLPLRPPASASSPVDDGASPVTHSKHSGWGAFLTIIWWILVHVVVPIALVLAVGWLIVFGKRRRARRRRTQGTPADRLSGAWREYLDRGFDHGHRVPPMRTRREQAASLNLVTAGGLARDADNTMFGRATPDEATVEAYWAQIDAAVGSLGSGQPRWKRITATLNPISLIPIRWRDRTMISLSSAKRGPR